MANWAGADVELVQETARKVLDTARTIVAGLEAELGVDLRPNPIADAINANRAVAAESLPPPPRIVAVGSTDEIIYNHLATGPLDWERLAASIPALESHRASLVEGNPDAQAVVLAEAGASPEANAAVLRAHGIEDATVHAILTVTVPDVLGARSTLYDYEEVARALERTRPIKPMADNIVADLLVSAGQHPEGARYLAETSGQPPSVINLMEERLRRAHPKQSTVPDHRANRGLALIDEWTGPRESVDCAVERAPQPQPPDPAA